MCEAKARPRPKKFCEAEAKVCEAEAEAEAKHPTRILKYCVRNAQYTSRECNNRELYETTSQALINIPGIINK